jgi:hypothetical protein
MADKTEKAESVHHEKHIDPHAIGTNDNDSSTPPNFKNGHDDLGKNSPIDLEAPGDESWRANIDTQHEKRILRKLDAHLLPFVSLLYLLSFL